MDNRLIGLLITFAALGGCASTPGSNDVASVSEGLQRRTGFAVERAEPGARGTPPSVSPQDGLDEREAVLLALWNNAGFQSTLADLGIAQAALVEAGALADPNFGAVLGAAPEGTLSLPIDMLWIRPRRMAVADLDRAKTTERLVQAGLDLILDTRLRWADLQRAHADLALAQEAERQAAEMARLSAVRVREGDLTAVEASLDQVGAVQAREQVERAAADVALAVERLRDVAGLTAGQWDGGLRPSPDPALPADPADVFVARALAARPDVRAAELELEAAGERVGLARAEAIRLALGIKVTEAATGGTLAGPLPLLNGGRGGVALARARLDKAAYDLAVVRARVETEVREAVQRWSQAEASRKTWRSQVLPPLEDSQARHQRAFASGDATRILVLESSRRLIEARRGEQAAAADARRAAAQLERHMGGALLGPPEDRS